MGHASERLTRRVIVSKSHTLSMTAHGVRKLVPSSMPDITEKAKCGHTKSLAADAKYRAISIIPPLPYLMSKWKLVGVNPDALNSGLPE